MPLKVLQDPLSIECSDCVGTCCRKGWDVAISADDIERFDGKVEYTYLQYKQGEPEEIESGPHKIKLIAARAFAPEDHPPKGKYIAILPKKIEINQYTGQPEVMCQYLDEKGRCAIHEIRPEACRSWGDVPCRLKIKRPT